MTWLPPSTNRTVLFPLNKDSDTFSSDFAEPHLASYQISHQEVTQFISQIETEYKLQKQSKKKDEREGTYIFCFNFFCLVLSSLILSRFIKDKKYPDQLISSEGFLVSFFLTLYLFPIWMWLWPSWKCDTYRFDEMRGKCQEILDEHNKILRSRGLKWVIPSYSLNWIELTKDMQKRNKEFCYNIPQSFQPTENIIFFPAYSFNLPLNKNQEPRSYRFSPDFYSSEMTDDRLSREEVQDFISEMNTDCRQTLKGYAGKATEKAIILPFFLSITFSLLLSFGYIHFRNLIGDGLYLLSMLALIPFTTILCIVRYKRETNKQKIQIRARCQRIVDKYNQNLRHQGLRWALPEKFPLWIELCKDYSSRIQLIDIPSRVDDLEAQRPKYDQNYHRNLQNDIYARLLDDDN